MIFLTHRIPVGREFVWVSVLFNGAVRCENHVMRVGVSECIRSTDGMALTGEPEVLAEKPVPPPLRPTQVLHALACDRTRLLARETGKWLPEP